MPLPLYLLLMPSRSRLHEMMMAMPILAAHAFLDFDFGTSADARRMLSGHGRP